MGWGIFLENFVEKRNKNQRVVDVVQENNTEQQENGIVPSLINGYREVW